MAPEQIQGKPRPASDQYALGIIVYEWLCGGRPFNGTAIEIAMQHALTPPPSLREQVPALSPDVERVVLTALAKDPKERFANVAAFARALEQAYRPQLPAGTTLLTYRGHSDSVRAVAWSPNGRCIASGSEDETVQVWDAVTGHKDFTNASSFLSDVAWSPDGTRIVYVDYDVSKQEMLKARADNETIVAGFIVRVLNIVSGNKILICHSSDIKFAVTWSPDGRRIASGSDVGTVQVWDATTGAALFTYRGHSQTVNAVAWSPDGRRIASASNDRTVQVWQAV